MDPGSYSLCMEDGKAGFIDWVIAGLGLGVGFGLASILFGAATFATLNVYWQHALGDMSEGLAENVRSYAPSENTRTQYRTVTRRIAPRSRETCLELTDGVGNEQYNRCRQGYSYRERMPVQ